MIPLPLSTWPAAAPLPLQYGTVAVSVLALAYLCGGRQILGRRLDLDVAVALIIMAATAVVGFVVLAAFSFNVVMGYLYGLLVGAMLMRLVGKYNRVT